MTTDSLNIPFAHREDCQRRFDEMRKSMGDLNGKTLVDIGCDRGYFMARFLADGGKSAVGIEPLDEHRQMLEPFGLVGVRNVSEVNTDTKFDFCFYLDLHYHEGINYIPWCVENSVVTYAATSGDGNKNNERFLDDLKKSYSKIDFVTSTNWADRKIYRCENVG